MSREVIFQLLHPEVLKLLESWGYRRLAVDVERNGMAHPIYDFLDRAFSMYYAEYGGVNCSWLEDAIRRDWSKVVKIVLPNLLKQYLGVERRLEDKKAVSIG
ncbi:conserved hypothetical protein [Pyrobaculum islandicum DSM 4184]|uniref:Uncharacterized protein n=1 Tax=Pyrobaculum islandicum (strain DSM 4184 / JCM 9189 / GEO3) TaxID=384616 RepID=A1RU49_PYRIL|nr:hypothetical protein [Pyrobaculum islandicum]ABL88481.1 conserved hypothetical protein [Pyrobaculum islandicum DSM 4184]